MHHSRQAIRRGHGVVLVVATFLLLGSLATGAEASAKFASTAQMQVRPSFGPGGTQIDAQAKGMITFNLCYRNLQFKDSAGVVTTLIGGLPFTDSFRARATIPLNTASGLGGVYVQDVTKVLGQCLPGYGFWIEARSEEHTSELQSRVDLVCRLLLE